jgi:hypothetical protein
MSKTRNVVIATVTAFVLLCPGAASAHETTKAASSFDRTKALCLRAISQRQATLDRLTTKVAANADPHDADLVALITTAKSGLIAAQAAIEGTTSDGAALKDACRHIVTDLRIYALRVPQINLVMTVDKLDAAMAKFDALHDQLADAVAAAGAAGDPDAAKAQEQLDKLDAKRASVGAKIDGIDVDALIAITPGAYNADKKVLRPYLQEVRALRADVKKASQLAKHIARLLEPGDGDDEA